MHQLVHLVITQSDPLSYMKKYEERIPELRMLEETDIHEQLAVNKQTNNNSPAHTKFQAQKTLGIAQ